MLTVKFLALTLFNLEKLGQSEEAEMKLMINNSFSYFW